MICCREDTEDELAKSLKGFGTVRNVDAIAMDSESKKQSSVEAKEGEREKF